LTVSTRSAAVLGCAAPEYPSSTVLDKLHDTCHWDLTVLGDHQLCCSVVRDALWPTCTRARSTQPMLLMVGVPPGWDVGLWGHGNCWHPESGASCYLGCAENIMKRHHTRAAVARSDRMSSQSRPARMCSCLLGLFVSGGQSYSPDASLVAFSRKQP
jgi:hypothetical protein